MHKWMYKINEAIILLNRFLLESKKEVEDVNKLNVAAQNIMEVLKDMNYLSASLAPLEIHLELNKLSKENKELQKAIYTLRLYDTLETIVVNCAVGPVSCSFFDDKEIITHHPKVLRIRCHISTIGLENLWIINQRRKEIDPQLLDEFLNTIENSIMKGLKSELGELLREKINKALPKHITKEQ